MGAYKDFLIGLEELVYTALKSGARDVDSVYAYVYMYEKRTDRETVQAILDDMRINDDMQLFVA